MLQNLSNLKKLSKKLNDDLHASIPKCALDKILKNSYSQIDALIRKYGEMDASIFIPPKDIEETYQSVVKLIEKKEFQSIRRKDLRNIAKYDKTYQDEENFPLFRECVLSKYWNNDKRICLSIFSIWVRYYKTLDYRKYEIKKLFGDYLELLVSHTNLNGYRLSSNIELININFDLYFSSPEIIYKKFINENDFSVLINSLLQFNLHNRGELFNDILLKVCLQIQLNEANDFELFVNGAMSSREFTHQNISHLLSYLIIESDSKNIAKKDIIGYILNFRLEDSDILEFGDFRIRTNEHNWQYVSDEAKQIFKRWRNTEDIKFFFDVIFDGTGDTFRQDFWLNYTESIEDIKFFINDNHRDLINGENSHILDNSGKITTWCSSSLFVMQFEFCYIYVASHKGDLALRIYAKNYILNSTSIKEHFKSSEADPRMHSRDDANELSNVRYPDLHRDKLYKITQNSKTWRDLTQRFLNSLGIMANKPINYKY